LSVLNIWFYYQPYGSRNIENTCSLYENYLCSLFAHMHTDSLNTGSWSKKFLT